MSMVKDAIKAMREVLVLSDKVGKSGALLSEMASELREHDRRLIRLETMVEVAAINKLANKSQK